MKKEVRKHGSIRNKLLIILIPLIVIVIALTLILNFIWTKKRVTNLTYQQLRQQSYYNVSLFESWKKEILASLQSVKNTIEEVSFSSDQKELKFLETTTTLHKSFPYGVYAGDADGVYLDGSGWKPDADYVVTERDWYQEGLKHETFLFGAPYLDANTGTFIVSATTLLNRSDRNQMVAAADIYLDDITKMIESIDIMGTKTGYAFLIDRNSSTILAHKDKKWNTKVISTKDKNPFLAKIAASIQNKLFQMHEWEDKGVPYFVTIQQVDGTGWSLVSCVSKNEVFKQLHQMVFFYMSLAILAILISAMFIWKVVTDVIKPIACLTSGITQMTKGDFTVQIKPQGNDEITVMSEALQKYIKNMNQIITGIRSVAIRLDENAQISKNSSEALNQTAKGQAQSMKDIQTVMKQFAPAVEKLAEHAGTLAGVVQTANQRGDTINRKINETVTIVNQGYQDMKFIKENMRHVVDSIKQLSRVVEEVRKSTREMNDVIQLIGDIAAQTNLLSLNATIEAARAGESGRGFAVVADEISNLVDVSEKSVQQIEEIIAKIESQIENMVQKTRKSVTSIEENADAMNQACNIFEAVYQEVGKTSEIMDIMIGEIRNVNDVASSMAEISQEQSASTQEIAETILALTNHSEQVASESGHVEECANSVSKSACTLKEQMKDYIV